MGSKSQSTATSTTSNYYDQREVNDAGGGIIGGSGNSQSQTNINTDGGAFDLVRSVADGVSQIGRDQIAVARDLATKADSSGRAATDFAIKAQENANGFAESTAGKAFDLARSSAAQAFASSGDALGFTRQTFEEVVGLAGKVVDQAGSQAREASTTAAGAYSAASDTASGNKTLIYAAIGAVALVSVAMAFRRG